MSGADDRDPVRPADRGAGAVAVAPAAAPAGPDPRFVVLGLVRASGAPLSRLGRGAAGLTQALVRPCVALAGAVTPAPQRRRARDWALRLDAEGRAAARAGSEALTWAAGRIGTHPLLARVVDDVVGQVRWRVVDEVLPVVLDRLAEQPELVREIVQDQSRGIVTETTQAARAQAAAADAVVDRLVGRLLRRGPVRRADPGRIEDGAPAPPDGPVPP